jgi:hypothetical protein
MEILTMSTGLREGGVAWARGEGEYVDEDGGPTLLALATADDRATARGELVVLLEEERLRAGERMGEGATLESTGDGRRGGNSSNGDATSKAEKG